MAKQHQKTRSRRLAWKEAAFTPQKKRFLPQQSAAGEDNGDGEEAEAMLLQPGHLVREQMHQFTKLGVNTTDPNLSSLNLH